MFQPLSFKCHCSATKCRINRNFAKELRRFCFLQPTHLPRRPLFKLDFNRFDYGWYQASILTWTGSSRLGSSGKLVRYRCSRLLLIFLTWKRRHRTTLFINEQPRKNSPDRRDTVRRSFTDAIVVLIVVRVFLVVSRKSTISFNNIGNVCLGKCWLGIEYFWMEWFFIVVRNCQWSGLACHVVIIVRMEIFFERL